MAPDAAEEVSKHVSISITHVVYEEGDLVGFLLAWFSLSPIFILVGLGTLVLVRRDLQTMFMLGGLVMNEGVNFTLKHLIKEPRPINEGNSLQSFGKYGMPSSHAQFMGWFLTYFSLFVFIKAHLSTGLLDYVWKTVCVAMAVGGSVLCCISRTYLGYHTMTQVVYGAVVGAGVAILWFILIQVLCEPYFSLIYQWRISEVLLLKDMSRIPNYMWFEYTSVRQETKKRLRRKSS